MDLLIELVGPCDYRLVGIYDPSRVNMIPPGSYIIARKVDGLHVLDESLRKSAKLPEQDTEKKERKPRKPKESSANSEIDIDLDLSDLKDSDLNLDDEPKTKSKQSTTTTTKPNKPEEDDIDWSGFEDDLGSQPNSAKSKIWREGTVVFINDNGTTLKREMNSEKNANSMIELYNNLGHNVFIDNAREKFVAA